MTCKYIHWVWSASFVHLSSMFIYKLRSIDQIGYIYIHWMCHAYVLLLKGKSYMGLFNQVHVRKKWSGPGGNTHLVVAMKPLSASIIPFHPLHLIHPSSANIQLNSSIHHLLVLVKTSGSKYRQVMDSLCVAY